MYLPLMNTDSSKCALPPCPAKVAPRRPYEDDKPNGYQESDRDYMENNIEACCWFLDNAERIFSCVNGSKAIQHPETTVPELVAALTQAQDTLAWAQHFSNHANKAAFTDTLAITEAALAKLGGEK